MSSDLMMLFLFYHTQTFIDNLLYESPLSNMAAVDGCSHLQITQSHWYQQHISNIAIIPMTSLLQFRWSINNMNFCYSQWKWLSSFPDISSPRLWLILVSLTVFMIFTAAGCSSQCGGFGHVYCKRNRQKSMEIFRTLAFSCREIHWSECYDFPHHDTRL